MRALAPPVLLCLAWGLSVSVACLALSLPGTFDLVPLFMRREGIGTDAFTLPGALWLALALMVALTADALTRSALPRPAPAPSDLTVAARLAVTLNTVFLTVTILWIALAALRAGGPGALLALAGTDPLGARALMLDAKLFPGMRLIYAALPATGGLAAALLATGRLPARTARLCAVVLVLDAVALVLLPLVMSQRLLLLQFVIAAYVGACLVRSRLTGLRWLALGAALFLAVWTLREAATNPTLDRSALTIGGQKLAFYLVNDLCNAFRPLATPIAHTNGAVTLEGLSVLTGTGPLRTLATPQLAAAEGLRGGGAFPLLTAPYVDFGPVLGAAMIAVIAAALRLAFHAGQSGPVGAALYGQVAAGIALSPHSAYLLNQNLLFAVALLIVTGRLAAPRAGPVHA